MDNPKLRKATAEDSEFAYRIKKAAFKEYVEKVWGWDEAEQRQLHARRFASQDFQVIQVSGMDVGVLAMVRQPDCVKVNQMFILPEYQGRGIGAACMMRIIEDAAASGLPVRLQVLKVNGRAVAFYQRLGFTSIGESDTHVLMERPSSQLHTAVGNASGWRLVRWMNHAGILARPVHYPRHGRDDGNDHD